MPVLKRRNTKRIQTLWRHFIKTKKQRPGVDERAGETPTTQTKNILKYGRKFLREFRTAWHPTSRIKIHLVKSIHESPVAVTMVYREGDWREVVGKIKLGFEKDTVVVETIQGVVAPNNVTKINDAIGGPWPNHLLRTIEEHAKKMGYRKIMIRDPEHMYWYRNPLTGYEEGTGEYEQKADKIRARMKNFYGRVAKANGYKKKDGFFEKDL